MARSTRSAGLIALAVAITAILVSFVIPGCTQNQENSPISVSNSQGRLALSVACSTDGSIAYVTDGRNVYRYNASGQPQPWQCILSESERLEMAVQHDPREQRQTASR
ncbi:MAG: hypothetical protein JW955_03060 [Sedimentisphaerales bacterium]|nr:hypothetical protein [Sedimentisphaerales bacterium]